MISCYYSFVKLFFTLMFMSISLSTLCHFRSLCSKLHLWKSRKPLQGININDVLSIFLLYTVKSSFVYCKNVFLPWIKSFISPRFQRVIFSLTKEGIFDFMDIYRGRKNFFLIFYLKGIPSLKMKLSQIKHLIINKIHKSFLGFWYI